jgi:hypothetical protein
METPGTNEIHILDLDDALGRLAKFDAGLARIVSCARSAAAASKKRRTC